MREEFLRAVAAKFPDDPTAPGVVLSYIAEKGMYYGSVVRFSARFGQGKFVAASAEGPTLQSVVDYLDALFTVEGAYVS
jgi:hypothetical protein